MEPKNIEKLLEKYWKGETSSAEEKELKNFFSNEPVPTHLKKEAALFTYYSNESVIKIEDPGFDQKLINKIQSIKISEFSWLKIAATFLLLFASIFMVYKLSEQAPEEEIADNTVIYEDPEIAYQETKKALLMISAKLNAPKKFTNEISKIDEASELFK